MTMEHAAQVETPELDRAQALNTPRKPFEVLTDFVDWLEAEGYMICKYGAPKIRRQTCPKCHGRKIDAEALTPRQRQLLHKGALKDEEWPPCPRCNAEGYELVDYIDEDSLQPIQMGWSRFFELFWNLDGDKMEDEKRALLQAISTPDSTPVMMKRCRNCQRKMESPIAWCCETCEMMAEDPDPRVQGARKVLARVMSHAPPHDDFKLGVNEVWVHFDVRVLPEPGIRSGWWHFGIWIGGNADPRLVIGEQWGALEAMDDDADPDDVWLGPPDNLEEWRAEARQGRKGKSQIPMKAKR